MKEFSVRNVLIALFLITSLLSFNLSLLKVEAHVPTANENEEETVMTLNNNSFLNSVSNIKDANNVEYPEKFLQDYIHSQGTTTKIAFVIIILVVLKLGLSLFRKKCHQMGLKCSSWKNFECKCDKSTNFLSHQEK